jgi:hypothetical protein
MHSPSNKRKHWTTSSEVRTWQVGIIAGYQVLTLDAHGVAPVLNMRRLRGNVLTGHPKKL